MLPGPEIVLVEGNVDGNLINVDLKTPAVLKHCRVTLAELRASAWADPMDPELEDWFKGLISYYYHLASASGGEWRAE